MCPQFSLATACRRFSKFFQWFLVLKIILLQLFLFQPRDVSHSNLEIFTFSEFRQEKFKSGDLAGQCYGAYFPMQ